jgi:1-deoxy-D-xylulose-5-phosphate reductoisomerase
MAYKNSIHTATLVNKCLEVIEAHYLFDIPLEKIKIIIHPESQIHSIFEFKNYIYNMIAFQNDMNIPIFHFLNQTFNKELNQDKYSLKREQKLNFHDVKFDQFPVYKFFNNLDKSKPSNIIKFNVANEFAVNQFKNKNIKYTDIPYLIEKISSLNLNYNLKTIKDIIIYHEILEIKINEKYNYL